MTDTLENIKDYQQIIDQFGSVAVQVEDDAYQGDTRILYEDAGSGFGYLCFGWGSCSGCDALEGCRTDQELAELIETLRSQVTWRPRAEMLAFFAEHDWEGDYSHDATFVSKAIAYLKGEPTPE